VGPDGPPYLSSKQRISAVAHPRHKRDTDARSFASKPFSKPPRAALLAAPIAVAATAAAVTVGLVSTGSGTDQVVAAADVSKVAPKPQPVPSAAVVIEDRGTSVSRSLTRRQAVKARTGKTQWTTTALDLWKRPGKGAGKAGEVKAATKVLATGRELGGRVEIVIDGAARWVTKGYLADQKPAPKPTQPPEPPGISMQPCPDSSVEDGLKPQTIKVYRSVCHAFPEVTEYGGWAARTEHDTGNAIDVMVYGDKALGDRIAAWAHEHAAELDLYDLIWWDRIWTPVRAAEGWRDYGDHGSPTANHMDHVHIGTN
jgi:hypothetical protein